MTARHFSDPTGNRQERITPFQKFDGNYLGILYNPAFPDILTVTEKKLLKLLNQYAFMDGKCYPKQTTLAAKLNCTTRQIRRLIKKLEQKGFIEVERPTLIERHVF
ncbi:MAG: helix-turn-helix domain-containing protein, partial [Deltaproteobacteria bacterium]|nr:helix-turn-helix domain-containing protein [Deltaproteobacteria bacterium]